MNNDYIQKAVKDILERNNRVEIDKAWEVSWVRRIFVSLITYLVAVLWLYIIDENIFWLKAVVPTVGYILSTITIPQLKKIWINKGR